MWQPGNTAVKSSVDYSPSLAYSAGGMSGMGGPLGVAGDPNIVWDDVRGGYWIKETVVENGMIQNGAQGYGGAGGMVYGSTGGGGQVYGSSGGLATYNSSVHTGAQNSGAITGWSGCKGCTFGQMKPSSSCSSCTSNRAYTGASSGVGNFVSNCEVGLSPQLKQSGSYHTPTPYHGCQCMSAPRPSYPVMPDIVYISGGGGGCGGGCGGAGGMISCGCHAPPTCSKCRAYH